MTTFATDRDAFMDRMAAKAQQDRQTIAVVKADIAALCQKLASANTELEFGNLGMVGAWLELARNDLDAAIRAARGK